MAYSDARKNSRPDQSRPWLASYGFAGSFLGNLLFALLSVALWGQSWAQASERPPDQVTVNSPLDGPVQPDAALTLREAIELMNGTLSVSELSAAEQALVSDSTRNRGIHFDLPAGDTTIELVSILPAIARPGLLVDGTTQPGYLPRQSATAEIAIPTPVVAIRPAAGTEIFRGLTISAGFVTVRGLSIYGFNSSSRITQSTPPADIFISHQPAPLNRQTPLPDTGDLYRTEHPPLNVEIIHNWLGITPTGEMPDQLSGFGVSVFDGVETTVMLNRIEFHQGSGIISGRQADDLIVIENIIVGNGLAGMPDAIRLDGSVENAFISKNLICGNDGSGIFLFKPTGAVRISDNSITFNGQRLRRAAVYVMGDDHQIVDNVITHQKGGGVVVTAFGQGPNTQSNNNVITGNRFESLEGLSIDLNAWRSRDPQNFQIGDGPNPPRDSRSRRQDTGNSAVNAPKFLSPEFFVIDGKTVVQGRADANNEVALYRAMDDSEAYGPLSLPVGRAIADENGEFEFVLESLVGGEVLSAIATDPRYGTSEPALNTSVHSLTGQIASPLDSLTTTAQCTAPPAVMPPPEPPAPKPEPPAPEPPAPEPPAPSEEIVLEVPRNIHFALDKDFISAESAIILDKIADALKQYPSMVVDLHGHTDSRASQSYNIDLARRRAENARRYLLSQGIGPERMTIRSFGETQLLVNETDRTNFARNRRVEFVFEDVQGANITFINQEQDLQIEP